MESKRFLIEKYRKQQQTVASCKIREIAKYIFQKWRVYIYIFVYVCICLYIYIYIHIYTFIHILMKQWWWIVQLEAKCESIGFTCFCCFQVKKMLCLRTILYYTVKATYMYLFIWHVKTDRNIFCILLFLEWMVNVLRSCPFVHLFDNPFQNSPYCQEVIKKKNHRIADIFFIPFIFQSHLINLNHSCLGIF